MVALIGILVGFGAGGQAAQASGSALPVPRTASTVLGATNADNGLHLVDTSAGHTVPVVLGGESARATTEEASPTNSRNLYFDVDDQFAYNGVYVATFTVQYWDAGTNSFVLQYDSAACSGRNPAYVTAGRVSKTDTGTWKTATFSVPDAHFADSENGGTDFRLTAGVGPVAGALAVHEVDVTIEKDNTPPAPTPPTPAPGTPTAATTVTLQRSADELTLDNGYVQVGFSLAHPQIDVIRADFDGRARYAADLTASGDDPLHRSGIVLERDDPDGTAHASSAAPGPDLSVTVVDDTPQQVTVRIDGIVDDPTDPAVTSSWTLSLAAGQRAFQLATSTRAVRATSVADVHLGLYWSAPAPYAQFDQGVVQMMNNPASYFASTAGLHRFYALGSLGGGAVDVTGSGQRETLLRDSPVISPYQQYCGVKPTFYGSALDQVLAGDYPTHDRWDSAGWAGAQPVQLSAGQAWMTRSRVAANNLNFPDGQLSLAPNLPETDLAAFLTAVYGTDAGVLDTYALPGETAPSLATPNLKYGDGRNFFDPDSYFITTALLYSGDPYLQQQARSVIEKSAAAMTSDGQIPHHFNGTTPTYVALSGASQTGPNIFWIEAALQYATTTGDSVWLRAHMPAIERATSWLLGGYNPQLGLVSAPGPLWIDTFVRNNYTADTNAFMVKLLRDVAAAEQFVGTNTDAATHRALAEHIVAGMNAHLWAGDHYVTQLNPDGSTRDFVDYDSNLLAVAVGVAPPDRAKLILTRVDAGACAHGDPANGQPRPTWVSELTYGPGDTYGGNTGDSAVTMGRIGWADGHARQQTGDLAAFNNLILDPVEQQIDTVTWLPERYNCAGNPAHASDYYEYPAMAVMLLREVRYGINLGLDTATIDPFGPRSYSYHLGDVNVAYSQSRVTLTLPGSGTRDYEIDGLHPNASYHVVVTGPGAPHPSEVSTDSSGTLRFTAPIGPDHKLLIQQTGPQ